jgi:predicted RNA-binding protein with PUA domain
MPKTVILAIFTLGLAAATLVTDFVSPYRGGPDRTVTVTTPAQVRLPAPAPIRQVREQMVLGA